MDGGRRPSRALVTAAVGSVRCRRCSSSTTIRTSAAPADRAPARRVRGRRRPGRHRGLAALATGRERPVVILDVQMPDLDGWQALGEIRATRSCVTSPVILCTVKSSQGDLTAGGRRAATPTSPSPSTSPRCPRGRGPGRAVPAELVRRRQERRSRASPATPAALRRR